MTSVIFQEAQAALRIDQPQNAKIAEPKIGKMSGRQIALIAILGSACIIGPIAAVICTIFASYVLAIALAAASLTLAVSTVVVSQIKNHQATLDLFKNLTQKITVFFREIQDLKNQISEKNDKTHHPVNNEILPVQKVIQTQKKEKERLQQTLVNPSKSNEKTLQEVADLKKEDQMSKEHLEILQQKLLKKEKKLENLKTTIQDYIEKNNLENLKKEWGLKACELKKLDDEGKKIIEEAKARFQNFVSEIRQVENLPKKLLKSIIVILNKPTTIKNRVIEYSPLMASLIIAPLLTQIDIIKRTQATNDQLVSDEKNSSLKRQFKEQLEQKPYDGEAVLKTLNEIEEEIKKNEANLEKYNKPLKQYYVMTKKNILLNQTIPNLENQPLIKIETISYDPKKEIKLSKTLEEFLKTEASFCDSLKKIKTFFDNLKIETLITEEEFNETTFGWNDLIEESEKISRTLKQTSDANINPVEQIRAFQAAFSPKNIKKYLEAFAISIPKFRTVSEKLDQIQNTSKGLKLSQKFSNENNKSLLRDFTITTPQRITRINLIMQDLSTKFDWNDEFQKALNHNLEYFKAYVEYINTLDQE